MNSASGEVPPRSIQIRDILTYTETKEKDHEYSNLASQIRDEVEQYDNLETELQEIRPNGVPGAPVDVYLVITAKSAAGAAGALAIKEIYQYLKQNYLSKSDTESNSDSVSIEIDEVHVNLSEGHRTVEELESESEETEFEQEK